MGASVFSLTSIVIFAFIHEYIHVTTIQIKTEHFHQSRNLLPLPIPYIPQSSHYSKFYHCILCSLFLILSAIETI